MAQLALGHARIVVTLAAVSGLLLLSLLARGAHAQPSLAKTVVTTDGWIGAIAMDGPIVAFDVLARVGACNRLRALNVKSARTWLVSGRRTCGADSTSMGAGVREVAVGGRRIAWIVNLGGNTESNDTLLTATLPRPVETVLASGRRRDEEGSLGTGRYLGHLVGAGGLLAVNDNRYDSDALVAATLRRVAPGLELLTAGTRAEAAAAADRGRVVFLDPGGSVSVWSRSRGFGTPIQLPGPAREAALDGDDLAVLLASGQLLVYSASSGAPTDTITASRTAKNIDVEDGVLVWSVGRRLFAARVGGSRGVPVVSAGRRIVAVELEPPGLAYAWNTVRRGKESGKLAFVTAAALRAALPADG